MGGLAQFGPIRTDRKRREGGCKNWTFFLDIINVWSLMEKFFTTGFNFSEFIFVYVVNIRFIYDDEIQLLTHGYLC